MNIRDLEYVVAVAEFEHFGKAADACFVSQPTLSAQIKKLEDRLGVTLFERSKRHVKTTSVGNEVVRRARRVLEEARTIEAVAQAFKDPLAGELVVGAIPTIAPYLMPLVLAPLAESHPQMTLALHENTTETLLGELRAHRIDCALLATPLDGSDLEEEALFDDPFWVAYPRDHELHSVERLTSSVLRNVDLLLLTEGHCLADQALEFSQRTRQTDALGDFRAASLETLLQFVAAGYGVTLLPAVAVQSPWLTESGIICRPLQGSRASRRVRIMWRRNFPRKEALRALGDVIRAHLPNTVSKIKRA